MASRFDLFLSIESGPELYKHFLRGNNFGSRGKNLGHLFACKCICESVMQSCDDDLC